MKKLFLLVGALSFCGMTGAQTFPTTAGFADCVHHWMMEHGDKYERYKPDQFREIANNIVAYQNPDGGWPKNIDVMARFNPDSIRTCIDARHLESTLDNTNVYPQVEYLSTVFFLTGDSLYCRSAARGMDYILSTQQSNGSWRGWDADAITFNDNIMAGVLSLWIDVLQGAPIYAWVGDPLKADIRASYDRGLALVLRCQYVQNGVKTVWPQQCDHETLAPTKARAYELPALASNESAGVVLMLMKIENPSPEVFEAVRAAAAWFERSAIRNKQVRMIDVPEGLAEDRAIKRDRILVDDPTGGVVWARFYDPDTNRPFFATRAGEKVATMAEVPAERRVGYAWYGPWGIAVLKEYPLWLVRTAREAVQAGKESRKAERKAARQARK